MIGIQAAPSIVALSRANCADNRNTCECVDPGPCKKKGMCNGCVFAHVTKDKPCDGHRYDGCRWAPSDNARV